MTTQNRLRFALDLAGTAGLISASTTLLCEQWLHVAAEGALFLPFFYSLALALGCLVAARLLQITQIVVNHSDPRRNRRAVLASDSTVEVLAPNVTALNENAKLQRAA
ncbi:MAG: hypothetical protein HYX63_14125 [Gammaproteobacteria bacterium]|nr:hypothetical protein [Gammaproteobacteria bacterium]